MTESRHLESVPTEAAADLFPRFHVGHRMELALERAGITKGEMAAALGVSPATLLRWMKRTTPVKRHVLLTWASMTGVSQMWLADGLMPEAGEPETLSPAAGLEPYAMRDLNPQPADYEGRRPDLRLVLGVPA